MSRTLPPRREAAATPGTARLLSRASAMLPWFAALALCGCLAAEQGISALRGGPLPQEFYVELPAVDLPARADHEAVVQPLPLWAIAPVDGWVHGYAVEAVDRTGEPVPIEVLHHLKLMMPARRELFMPIMLRLAGAGAETDPVVLPSSLGFPLEAGDSLLATAMLHNPQARDYMGVRLRVRLRYTPAGAGRQPSPAYPFFIHVTPPDGHSGFDLPPGRSERSWEARPAVAGRVIGFGGHLHRYGVELRLEEVESGRVLWRGRAQQDEQGRILRIDRKRFVWRRGVVVRPDRVYRVTAVYDNPTGEYVRDGGMGTVGGAVSPLEPWPAADRGDAVYRLDRERESAPAHHHHP